MSKHKSPQDKLPQHDKYRCPGCGYTYDEAMGDDHEGYPPGLAFADLPDDFVCPDCSVRDKQDFELTDTSERS